MGMITVMDPPPTDPDPKTIFTELKSENGERKGCVGDKERGGVW